MTGNDVSPPLYLRPRRRITYIYGLSEGWHLPRIACQDGISAALSRCTRTMDITTSEVDPLRDVYLALQTATSVQESIRHADAKAQMLLGLDGGIAVVAADHASALCRLPPPMSVAAVVLSAIMLGSLAVVATRLLIVVTPRLAVPRGRNRFAFPSLAAQRCYPAAELTQYRAEAWQLVTTLSKIATAKHTGVRRSIAPLAVALASAGALFMLALATGNVL
jgi:hypothetical protein